jgi:hypothetical protein
MTWNGGEIPLFQHKKVDREMQKHARVIVLRCFLCHKKCFLLVLEEEVITKIGKKTAAFESTQESQTHLLLIQRKPVPPKKSGYSTPSPTVTPGAPETHV